MSPYLLSFFDDADTCYDSREYSTLEDLEAALRRFIASANSGFSVEVAQFSESDLDYHVVDRVPV